MPLRHTGRLGRGFPLVGGTASDASELNDRTGKSYLRVVVPVLVGQVRSGPSVTSQVYYSRGRSLGP
jgi:hypothetical protein